jgi:hypothetical protein
MKYFFGFVASIGLIVVVVILVIRGFSGGSTPAEQVDLLDYASTNAVVSMTIDGRINANELHRSAEVTVGRSNVRMEVFKGYERQVLESKSYLNNDDAFADFLRALQLAGFTKGATEVTSEANDPRGVCPNGQRYIFKITSGPSDIQNFWTTTCGGGTFKGTFPSVRQLFTAQVPDYTTLVSGVAF